MHIVNDSRPINTLDTDPTYKLPGRHLLRESIIDLYEISRY